MFLNLLIGLKIKKLLILKIKNLKVGMMFLKKSLILKPKNLKIGMMNLMVNGKLLLFLILNIKENGDLN